MKLTSGGKTLRGTIDATGPDEIVVRTGDRAKPTLRLSSQQMTQLEVVRGRRSRWAEGALIGFLPGALFLGYAGASLGECDPECNQTGEVLVYGLVGGTITAAVGAPIGGRSWL